MSAGRGLRRLPKAPSKSASLLLRRTTVVSCHEISRPLPSNSRASLSNVSCRAYSSQNEARQPDVGPESRDGDQIDDAAELRLEEEMLAIQDAAIAELEQRLGKPLHEAIKELHAAERILRAPGHGVLGGSEDIEEIANNRISQLRATGATSEDVAREARNLFGEYLPEATLSSEETKIYTRLYGEPLPDIDEEESLYDDGHHIQDENSRSMLFDAEGEEVRYRLESEEDIHSSMGRQSTKDAQDLEQPSARVADVQAIGLDVEAIAKAVQGDVYDQDEYDELEQEDDDPEANDEKSHPLTSLGRFATSPRTFFIPQETFVRPVESVMSQFSNKQLKDMCERTFGGPGLPDSPLTPRIARSRQQVPIPLDASQHTMGQMEANAFMTTVMPPTYASIQSVLVETRKRLGSSWLNRLLAKAGGPRVLDAGSGGVGILAWRNIVNAHWEQLHSSDKNPPQPPVSKSVVLTGSDTLRHRAAAMLENTTFVPRLPDYIHTRGIPTLEDERPAQQRKQFDVIIASHSLFGLKEEWERKQHVQNLWSLLSDQGGVLIFVEKGIPRGFETVAAAREMLLERYIAVPDGQKTYYSSSTGLEDLDPENAQKTTGMIIAPCTNHDRCPLYKTSGVSKGRKDICSFQQRYIRPPFLQRVLGAKDRNHDDVDFSYLAVMKGDDLRNRSFTTWDHVNDPVSAPKALHQNAHTSAQQTTVSQMQEGFEYSDPTWSDSPAPPPTHLLPRIMNAPLKRRGHVTIDLCTPTAEIRRWTIPKSFSRQAYRDARKARWGDLWALGAKTSVMRNLKLGTPMKDFDAAGGQMKGSIGMARSRKERLQMQAEKILEAEEAQKDDEEREKEELLRLIDEDNLIDVDDEDELIDMDTLVPKKKADKPTRTQRSATVSPAQTHPSKMERDAKLKKPTTVRPQRGGLVPDTGPERMGEVDDLAAWSDEYASAMLDDEAYRGVSTKSGRRPTSKNTRRLKRDLRRAKREGSIE
ncbi:37S ribosomal protein S22 [Neophaeococcomyces mojaviensis]|uniref:37S ribosomal protein S22 n=1 Tax=Neophaeococcomyces mojaviensis TaxID=3383035 RepID=A0ACC3AAA8_9EURO|nr:37S ribosomal protein S22 [Knufia sp. JES_112]